MTVAFGSEREDAEYSKTDPKGLSPKGGWGGNEAASCLLPLSVWVSCTCLTLFASLLTLRLRDEVRMVVLNFQRQSKGGGSRATSRDDSSFVCRRGRALELSWLCIAFGL